jgi:hypothetical protein
VGSDFGRLDGHGEIETVIPAGKGEVERRERERDEAVQTIIMFAVRGLALDTGSMRNDVSISLQKRANAVVMPPKSPFSV